MPLDDRLRDAIEEEAATFQPDVEEHLRRVRARSRSPQHMLRAPLAAAAVLILAVVALRITDFDPRAMGPFVGAQPPVASPSPRAGIAGTFRASLDAELAVDGARSFVGDWVLTLGSDSTVVLVPPATFDGPGRRFEGVVAVVGDQIFTTLFAGDLSQACAGDGAYRWTLTSDRLLLDEDDDMCPERIRVLTSAPWIRVAE